MGAQSAGARMALARETLRAATGNRDDYFPQAATIGWRPTCECRGQQGRTVPCVVLDPFAGSGTTGRVAVELRRRAVLVDLAYHGEGYAALAAERTRNVQVELLS